jgi:hypothetical protein
MVDVFVYDRQTHMIERVNLAAEGTQGSGWVGQPDICPDGRFVSFDSDANSLVASDTNGVNDAFVTANPFTWPSGSHAFTLTEG